VFKRYTGLTGTVANFSGIRFIHLRPLRRNPFEPLGLRAISGRVPRDNFLFARPLRIKAKRGDHVLLADLNKAAVRRTHSRVGEPTLAVRMLYPL
jgi:hypothetical protein